MNRHTDNENNAGTAHKDIIAFSENERTESRTDSVTIEEPLQIILSSGDSKLDFAVIMRTPCHDIDLVTGFLYSEGIIRRREDILSVSYDNLLNKGGNNVVVAKLAESAKIPKSVRGFVTNSSCGVCGKTAINDIFLKGTSIIAKKGKVSYSLITELPSRMKQDQKIFDVTGGVHAAGLFDFKGNLVLVREDIGRHNAVDKVIGYLLRKNLLHTEEYVLQVSGRAGFEIIQKAVAAGFPIISSVSAPSSLAIETAEAFGATLICFVREQRFNLYTHPDRIE